MFLEPASVDEIWKKVRKQVGWEEPPSFPQCISVMQKLHCASKFRKELIPAKKPSGLRRGKRSLKLKLQRWLREKLS